MVYKLTETNPNLALQNKKIEIGECIPIKWNFKEKIIMKKK